MKKRDILLFSAPLILGTIIVLALFIQVFQLTAFRKTYLQEVRTEMKRSTRMFVQIVKQMMEDKELGKLQTHFNRFGPEPFFIEIVDEHNRVVTDSDLTPRELEQHMDRPGVQELLAEAAQEKVVIQYSDNLAAWVSYYSIPFHANGKSYELHIASECNSLTRILRQAKFNMIFFLATGITIVVFMILYICLNVRLPLQRLQTSIQKIASGDSNDEVYIPERGIVREIALFIRRMVVQLKEHIQSLEDSKNERDAIFNAMTEAILVLDDRNILFQWNRTAAELFALPPDASSVPLADVKSSALENVIGRALNPDIPFAEIQIEQKGGSRYFMANVLPFARNGKRCLLISLTDISSVRNFNAYRTEFLSNVSHELKTPLTAIISAVESLEDGALKNPVFSQKCFSILSAQSQRLKALLQDVLSLASLESPQTGPEEFFPLSLGTVVQQAVAECRPEAQAHRIGLKLVLPDAVNVRGDFVLLVQAVANLIRNAILHSGSSRIEVAVTPTDHQAVLSVRDWGHGIAPEHRDRIFERFYRVNKARSRDLGETGLGLAIVKHIVQLHHGMVRLVPVSGPGCCFQIKLPLFRDCDV